MLKAKLYGKFKKYFEEYLFGFDQNQLQLSLLSGNVNLTNVNIRPDKINEIFQKKGLPIALKAGMISKLSVRMNLINIFSDSLKITVEDLLFIVGPNIAHVSQEEDFASDINTNEYDENNPLNNLLRMHKKVLKQRKKEQDEEKLKNKEQLEADKKKKAEKQKKQQPEQKKEFKEVKGISWIISLLGGLKLEIKRIHFRYEDDYFQQNSPFSFGLMIDSISMDNSDTDWQFESLLSMNFFRQKPFNAKTVVKELVIKNVRAYWNSMSEMFVPTSLWEQTRHLKYQIFEAMDAAFLKEIMVDAFESSKLQNTYLMQPFTIFVSINLNNNYYPQSDPYRYQINLLISQIQFNFNPDVAKDMFRFRAFIEMFSYCRDLKKFRPLLRIQSFLGKKQLNAAQKKKKTQVIRDWFQFVLWYIRLKNAAKGETPFKLLEVEAAYQENKLQNAILKVKRASLDAYIPYHGEGEDDVMEELKKTPDDICEDDAFDLYEKQQLAIKKSAILKDMLSGTKFSFRLEGIKVAISTPGLKIRREHKDLPNFEFDLGLLYIHAIIDGANVIAKVMIKEIKTLDYFKREPEKASNKLLSSASHNALKNIYSNDNSMLDHNRSNAQSAANFNSGFNPQQRFTIQDMHRNQAQSAADYMTPNKRKARLTDILYGSGTSQERTMSRATHNPYDFFNMNIPDPTKAQSKARETMTISSLLNNSNQKTQRQQPVRGTHHTSAIMDSSQFADSNITPMRASKIKKAQKFQSPYSMNDKRDAMNHMQLNQRSEVFVDDQLERVDKRCFFLLCGKSNVDPCIGIDFAINAFDDPAIKKKIVVAVNIDQIVVEYCSEIFKSMTNIILEFKQLFHFSDLHKAPNTTGKKKYKKSLQRLIELQAPIYVLRKHIIKKGWKVSSLVIKEYQTKIWIQMAQNKSKQQSRKELKDKEFAKIQKIKALDKKLVDLNFDVSVGLKQIHLGLTADKDDPFIANQTLLEFGIENQTINLTKEDFKCKVSVFGIYLTALNSFEMLYMFVNKLKKVSLLYKEDLAVQTSIKTYKEFVQNIQKSLERRQELKRKEQQKEFLRKGNHPKIVVLNDKSYESQDDHFQFSQPMNHQQQNLYSNDLSYDNINHGGDMMRGMPGKPGGGSNNFGKQGPQKQGSNKIMEYSNPHMQLGQMKMSDLEADDDRTPPAKSQFKPHDNRNNYEFQRPEIDLSQRYGKGSTNRMNQIMDDGPSMKNRFQQEQNESYGEESKQDSDNMSMDFNQTRKNPMRNDKMYPQQQNSVGSNRMPQRSGVIGNQVPGKK